MTYKEAIKALEKELLYNLGTEKAEAYRMAINAMELQVAKKIEIKLVGKDRTACCPICGDLLSTYYRLRTGNYCEICGNKLDWSEE